MGRRNARALLEAALPLILRWLFILYPIVANTAFEAVLTPNAVTHQPFTIRFATVFEQPPAVFSSMQTFNGGDPAHLRLTSAATASGCSIFIEEETCSDAELAHVAETLGVLAVATNWETFDSSSRSDCFAEFEMIGRNEVAGRRTCLFDDGLTVCTFGTGDGIGGTEKIETSTA